MIDGYEIVKLEPFQLGQLGRALARRDRAQEILQEREQALELVAGGLTGVPDWKIAEGADGRVYLLRPTEAPSPAEDGSDRSGGGVEAEAAGVQES